MSEIDESEKAGIVIAAMMGSWLSVFIGTLFFGSAIKAALWILL